MPEEKTLKTAARYLGVKTGTPVGPEMRSLLCRAFAQMQRAAAPAHALKRLRATDGAEGFLPLRTSKDLRRLLHASTEAYALLATLGMGVDLLIRKLGMTEPALAAAVSACASAYIDEYINGVLKQERERLFREEGTYLTPRFSPGYGDVPLSLQPALLSFLGAERLGVYLTESLLMIPEKSVSVLMGITKEPGRGCHIQCENCAKTDCAFREE